MLTRLAVVLVAIFVAFLLPDSARSAERRVALVLGNTAYRHAIPLPNASGDAEAIAGVLKSVGFEVVLGTNLSRDAMAEKLGQFAGLAGGADVALFFYAGHGMQLDGKNLLIPVDADLKSELDAKVRTLEIDSVLQHTIAEAKVKIVLLDACRDNPFAQQIRDAAPKTRSIVVGAGLAEMRPGEGTLIAFATGPGQVALDGEGKHSPFTRALLAHLTTPDVEIRHALTRVRAQVVDDTRKQQLPWENTNMTGFFFMNRSANAAEQQPVPAAVAPAAPGGFDPRLMEMELWSAVKSSNNVDEYKAYLEKYPNGTFADLARTRIASLSRSTAPGTPEPAVSGEIRTAEANSATEDALGLDREQWRGLQRQLTALGFSTKGTSGQVKDSTRKGISAWQSARGYPASGYLNKLQRDALLQEKVAPKAVASDSDGGRPARRSHSSGGAAHSSRGDRGSAGAAGEFMGGVIRGAVGHRFGF